MRKNAIENIMVFEISYLGKHIPGNHNYFSPDYKIKWTLYINNFIVYNTKSICI